jgi:signal transduction histidine kinase
MKNNLPYDELLTYASKLETRIRQLEQQITENAVKAEQLKTRFLSNISHEIRTPMNAIIGFSSLLNDQQLSFKKREEYMDHINKSSAKLLNMVEAMIDVSLIESGQLHIRNEECYVNQLMQDIFHYFNIDRHKNEKNHIALLLNLQVKSDDYKIFTDQYRLQQVLTNLLSNAFRFTEKGIIEFGYQMNDDNEKITFFVSDSGKGILKEKSKMIFENFENVEEVKKIDSGVGLDLTLSKGIIELMGGKLWIEENVFHGSTLKFTIPCQKNIREMGPQLSPFASKLFIA